MAVPFFFMNLVPDFETKLLLDIHDRLLPWPQEWKTLEGYIRERATMVRTGVARCPSWFQEELNRLDSRLRAWWDSWNERWVIDRLQDEGVVERLARVAQEEQDATRAESMKAAATGLLEKGRYYLTILQFTPTPQMQLDRTLLDLLRQSDMQRFETPGAYLAQKREDAAAVQKANEAKGTEKVLEAVDGMSRKQVDSFIAVETAMRTGETIVSHGADLRFLEHAQAETDKARARGEVLDNAGAACNPGMHPLKYVRKPRKEPR